MMLQSNSRRHTAPAALVAAWALFAGAVAHAEILQDRRDSVVAAAAQALQTHLRSHHARLQIDVRCEASAQMLERLRGNEWVVKDAEVPLRRHVAVLLETSGSTKRESLQLPFEVHAQVATWRLSRAVHPDSVLTQADTEAVVEDALSLPDTLVADAATGLRVRGELPQGHVLRTNDVVSSGAVLRGDVVELLYEQGALSLQSSGVALSDAQPGQAVKVALQGRRDVVAGVVTNARRVLIQP